MLLMKNWYETRLRFLFLLAISTAMAVWVAMGPLSKLKTPYISGSVRPDVSVVFNLSLLGAIMLAGAGIKTQPGFQNAKGMHGSMHYTLSMPVTRTRLLAIRVAVGLAETAGLHLLMCIIFWLTIPVIRLHANPSDICKYGFATLFVVATLHLMSVLYATFLDDQYQWLASIFTMVALMITMHSVPLPPAFDSLMVLTSGSPLVTHSMPWLGIGLLLIISLFLWAASAKIVESREY